MNRVAIAFLTKDRVELSKRTIEPLLQPDKFDLWWVDGSSTLEGQELPEDYSHGMFVRDGIRGGADAAIVYAFTVTLNDSANYTHVGLVENDVLLADGWFEQTMALFERGRQEGLNVGAASPRCYEDRILIQREDYAVMHNLGAGVVIFTREAARHILDSYRNAWSVDNRLTFGQLAGIDIGPTWAFKGGTHWLTADWGFDATLARTGLASLALTPSLCEMIGQTPSLEEQGLRMATGAVPDHLAEAEFDRYKRNLARVYNGEATIPFKNFTNPPELGGGYMYFAHQVGQIGATRWSAIKDWRLKWSQGFGPFAFRAAEAGAAIEIPVAGPCDVMVSGGLNGGCVSVVDDRSGYQCDPTLQPEGPSTQVFNLVIPGPPVTREITLTALDPGVVFYGLRTHMPQMIDHSFQFDHSHLPPV